MTEIEKWMNMYSSTEQQIRKCTENMDLNEIHENLVDLEEIFEEYKKIEELRNDIDHLLAFCKEGKDVSLMHLAVLNQMIEQYKERIISNRKRVEEAYDRIGFKSDLI